MREHPLTWSLIIINVAVYLLLFSMPAEMHKSAIDSLSLSFDTMHEVWRWFTSMFVHASASHLFFNMLGLYFFGKALEELEDKHWYLAVYLISGILGSLAFIGTSAHPVVGASGAIFGLLGSVMFLAPTRVVHMYVIPLPLGVVAVMFVVFESLVSILRPLETDGIATIAHIGGILTGSIFAFAYNAKKSTEGLFVLILCFAMLLLLSPVFGVIMSIGEAVLSVVDLIVGAILNVAASLLSFIWR